MSNEKGFWQDFKNTLYLHRESIMFMANNDTIWDLHLGPGLFGIIFVCLSYAFSVIFIIEGFSYFEELIGVLKTYEYMWNVFIKIVIPLLIATFIVVLLRFYFLVLLGFSLSKLSYKTEMIEDDEDEEEDFYFECSNILWKSLNNLFYDMGVCLIHVFIGISFNWIPFMSWILYFTFLLSQCYSFGFLFFQIVLGRQEYPEIEVKEFEKNYRGNIFGVGFFFMMWFFLFPVIGWYTGPSLSIITATFIVTEKKKKGEINSEMTSIYWSPLNEKNHLFTLKFQ